MEGELGKYITPKGFVEDHFCTYLVDLSLPLELIWNKIDRRGCSLGYKACAKDECYSVNSKDDFECFTNAHS
jgi:hypothetical protein